MVAGDGAGVSSVVVATAGAGGGVTATKGCWFKPRSQGGEGDGVGKVCAEILAGWRGTLVNKEEEKNMSSKNFSDNKYKNGIVNIKIKTD